MQEKDRIKIARAEAAVKDSERESTANLEEEEALKSRERAECQPSSAGLAAGSSGVAANPEGLVAKWDFFAGSLNDSFSGLHLKAHGDISFNGIWLSLFSFSSCHVILATLAEGVVLPSSSTLLSPRLYHALTAKTLEVWVKLNTDPTVNANVTGLNQQHACIMTLRNVVARRKPRIPIPGARTQSALEVEREMHPQEDDDDDEPNNKGTYTHIVLCF